MCGKKSSFPEIAAINQKKSNEELPPVNERDRDDPLKKDGVRKPRIGSKSGKFPFWEEAEKSDASSLKWNAKIGLWPVLFAVIALGLLSAQFFPAVTSVINNPERAQAVNDVTQYAAAMKAYVTEYGEYPAGGAARTLKALRGDNPRS